MVLRAAAEHWCSSTCGRAPVHPCTAARAAEYVCTRAPVLLTGMYPRPVHVAYQYSQIVLKSVHKMGYFAEQKAKSGSRFGQQLVRNPGKLVNLGLAIWSKKVHFDVKRPQNQVPTCQKTFRFCQKMKRWIGEGTSVLILCKFWDTQTPIPPIPGTYPAERGILVHWSYLG